MSSIKSITALEVLDSRGNPTVQAEVKLEDGNLLLSSNREIQQFPEYVESRYSSISEKQQTLENILSAE